jgi:hypothetical protein
MALKLKVGDKATVIKRDCGHRFKIGSIVEILTANESDNYYDAKDKKGEQWFITEDNLKILNMNKTTPRISRTRALHLMQNSKGHFITVEFVKKDGQLRKLTGQYIKDVQPTLGLGNITLKEAIKAKLTPKDSLRQFNINSLKSLKTGGILYKIRN